MTALANVNVTKSEVLHAVRYAKLLIIILNHLHLAPQVVRWNLKRITPCISALLVLSQLLILIVCKKQ